MTVSLSFWYRRARKNDIVYIYYYENGEALSLHETYTVDRYGDYGVTEICKEDHLIGWIGIFDDYSTINLSKFEKYHKTEDFHYNYSYTAESYGREPYTLNSMPISEDEYTNGIKRYNFKNWVIVGREYNIVDLSPLPYCSHSGKPFRRTIWQWNGIKKAYCAVQTALKAQR